jgi:DNA-binding MarR family transcriptional regulator
MNPPEPRSGRDLTDADFVRLLDFRTGLRRFLHWSEGQARAVGVTPAQHQLLLAIRGHGTAPSVGEVAEYLLLRHHSAVELVDRAVKAELVRRVVDADDQRVVRIELTDQGHDTLNALARAHLDELSRIGPRFESLWKHLAPSGDVEL